MNRIKLLFEKKPDDILSVYFTAGFPEINDTIRIANSLQKSGVDLIEIGIPYSDPVADGPVIQSSNIRALNNGMTLQRLFKQLESLRASISIPVILMGYLNPVLQYGIEEFCATCKRIGVDGVILPDLPLEVYLNEYQSIFKQNDIKNIFLITSQTSEERVRLIDYHSDGFVYMVSSNSITGASVVTDSKEYFKRIKHMKLMNPTLMGFGISSAENYQKALKFSNGAIIGSAFIEHIKSSEKLEYLIERFVEKIRPAPTYDLNSRPHLKFVKNNQL